jgi:hypothetical protein
LDAPKKMRLGCRERFPAINGLLREKAGTSQQPSIGLGGPDPEVAAADVGVERAVRLDELQTGLET